MKISSEMEFYEYDYDHDNMIMIMIIADKKPDLSESNLFDEWIILAFHKLLDSNQVA